MSSDTLSPELGKPKRVQLNPDLPFSLQDTDYSQLLKPSLRDTQIESYQSLFKPSTSQLLNYQLSHPDTPIQPFKTPLVKDDANLASLNDKAMGMLERIIEQNERIIELLSNRDVVYEHTVLSMDETLVDYFIPRKKNKK
ncbi:hypothetical protein HDV01_000790 [Terramyces sp. JEL0728]|nr:hypothetical protein HDV01_000790 [Terramyces sp. JEL0728]